jgi:hypothetical protein
VILGIDYLDPREAIVSYKDKHVRLTLPDQQNSEQTKTIIVPFRVFEQEPKGEMETETLLHNPRLTLVAPHTLYVPPQSQQIIEAIDPGGPRPRQAFGMIE